MTEENKPNDIVENLISSGAEIAGGAIGGALGFFAAGPAGAAAGGAGGAAAASALKHIGHEIGERFLAPREKARAGGVLAIAADNIKRRVEAGDKLREDNFFENSCTERTPAEEIAESVILKAQREPEEKKIPFMGNLLSNISFDSQISTEMGHQTIKISEQLSYRQLCIFKLAAVKQQLNLKNGDYREHGSFHKDLYQVLYECLDLYHRGLVNYGGGVAFGPTDINPAQITIQGLGADIFNLMGLISIPDQDVISIAKVLQ